jgi:transposase
MVVSPQRRIMERRRKRAWQLHQRGWRACDIAQALSVSRAAVSTWLSAARSTGEDALSARPRTGAPARLSARHRLMLSALLRDDPTAYGYEHSSWRIADAQHVIKRLFDVEYTSQHVGRLIRAAQQSTEALPPMLRVELDELLSMNNVNVVRRRLERQGRQRKTSTTR